MIKKITASIFALALSAGTALANQQLVTLNEPDNSFNFAPVQTWHFGKGKQSEGNPCIFSTVFENGYAIQVYEKKEYINSFIIDFGQAVFEEGKFFPFILSVNSTPKEVRGLAVTRSAIRFNMTKPIDASTIENYPANAVSIRTEDAEFRLSLTGFDEVLKVINGCEHTSPEFDAAKNETEETKETKEVQLDVEAVAVEDISETERDAAAEEEMHPLYPLIPIVDEEIVQSVAAVPPKVDVETKNKPVKDKKRAPLAANETDIGDSELEPVTLVDETKEKSDAPAFTWMAKKGETLSDVLYRWSDAEGIKIKWQSDKNPVLTSNIGTDAPFEDAVDILMSSVGKTEKVFASIQTRAEQQKSVKDMAVNNWRGLHGMDLQSVLENWTKKANVILIWETDKRYNLQEEFTKKTSFADAVQSVLNQFGAMNDRPVAQLNSDPDTGQLALIIRSAVSEKKKEQKS